MIQVNEKRLGPHQKNALAFAREYPGWQGYAKDSLTKRVIASLAKRGLVETNEFYQFRAIPVIKS